MATGSVKYLVDINRALSQVLAEYSTAGAVLASYVYADDLISMNRNDAVSYYHFGTCKRFCVNDLAV
jgi:hypothetical protein